MCFISSDSMLNTSPSINSFSALSFGMWLMSLMLSSFWNTSVQTCFFKYLQELRSQQFKNSSSTQLIPPLTSAASAWCPSPGRTSSSAACTRQTASRGWCRPRRTDPSGRTTGGPPASRCTWSRPFGWPAKRHLISSSTHKPTSRHLPSWTGAFFRRNSYRWHNRNQSAEALGCPTLPWGWKGRKHVRGWLEVWFWTVEEFGVMRACLPHCMRLESKAAIRLYDTRRSTTELPLPLDFSFSFMVHRIAFIHQLSLSYFH